MDTKPPLPPFTPETARYKVRMAEDAWNTRDPDQVVLVYAADRSGCESLPADSFHGISRTEFDLLRGDGLHRVDERRFLGELTAL
jgi:nuclear transport factor 2 (NTF2) superfamily protein